MANAVNNVEVSDVDDFEMSEAERKTIKGELNELLNPKNGDDKEERRQTLSAQEVVEQPDVAQLIESVAKLNWTEASGKCFVGTGFLAKITLGVEDRLGFFTAGHNLYDKGTKQLVKASDIKLRFKDIRKHTIKVAFSKFLRQNYLLIVAYKTTKIISRNGQESTQPCRKGLDFGAVIFTDPVDSAARFLSRLGLSYLQVASPGACSSAYKMPVQLIGFPQYEENYSPMRILPGNELVVPPGNIPDHSYDLETEPGASGGSVLDKAGRVVAVHIRGGDQGNWGLGFDIIREELQLCLNIPSLPSQAQPGTSDPHKPQGMPPLVRFLKNLKLDKYINAFQEDDIDMEILEDCEPEELGQLLEKLEVSFGHSKKIIKALKHEKQEKKEKMNLEEKKEQMKKEQEREEDQLENIDKDVKKQMDKMMQKAVAREEKPKDAKRCPSGHLLLYQHHERDWYCDGCDGGPYSAKEFPSRYRCQQQCDYDLCTQCYSDLNDVNEVMSVEEMMNLTVAMSLEQENPTGDLIVSADEGEAAEYWGARMGLYRQLDGSSYQQVGGKSYLYQVLPERHWYINDVLMEKTGFMKNPTESSSVPASGWKYVDDDDEWRDDPELSVRMLGQELQCNTITITSSRCTRQEVLGDFRRIKNDVLNGHPVFRNSFNHYLRVRTGFSSWNVDSQRDGGGAWLVSGRATSCPAHHNSGLTRRFNEKHWTLWDGKNWVEDPTFVVTCNDTV